MVTGEVRMAWRNREQIEDQPRGQQLEAGKRDLLVSRTWLRR
jgi:hypothetical protein